MSINKIDEQLDMSFNFLLKIHENENIDTELFAITMTLFHYYTYYKSFKSFDKYKLIIACLFLACKIKGKFLQLDKLKEFYRKFSLKNSDINEKDIIGFELDLLIFLGFEVDIETTYTSINKLIRNPKIHELLRYAITETVKCLSLNLNKENKDVNQSTYNNSFSEINEKRNFDGVISFNKTNNHLSNQQTSTSMIIEEGKFITEGSINNLNNKEEEKQKIENLNVSANTSTNPSLLINGNQKRETKVIDSSNIKMTNFNLRDDYFKTLTVDEIKDKILILSNILILDVYRRPFCVVFKPKCIALCCIISAFNLVIDSESKYYLDLKLFFSLIYEEDEYKEFLICYSELFSFLTK